MTQEQKENLLGKLAREKYGKLVHMRIFKEGAKSVLDNPKEWGLTARKPLGIQETRKLVNQMLAAEISISRLVEIINEGGMK